MDEDGNEITRRLLTFALEIISLLSGEDYTIVRKTSGDSVTPMVHLWKSGGRSQSPITEPPPHPLIHERKKKKILELSNKMIELLTGEVPIRCQDVAVFLSMEEWEYLEGHKDRYEEVMMEDLRPLTSPDGSRRRNPPERCPHPLYPQYRPEEKHKVPESHQGEDLIDIKVAVIHEEQEAIAIWADQQDGSRRKSPPETCPRPLCPQDRPEEKHNIPESHQGEDLIDIKVAVIHGEQEAIAIWADQQDGSRRRDPPERCPRPLYPLDRPEEKHNVPGSHQGEDLIDIKVEVIHGEQEAIAIWTDQQDVSSRRNPTERCPCPLYPQDRPEEKHNVPESYQGEDPTKDNVEDETEDEVMTRGHQPCVGDGNEEIPVVVSTGNPCENNGISMNCNKEDIRKLPNGENLITLHVHPGLPSTSLSYNPPNYEEPSPEQSWIITTIPADKVDTRFQCDKQFTKNSDFLTKRKHKGEKPYSCSECGKCFTRKSSLVNHERSHTGEKLYSCSECGKCFTRKSSLVNHEIIHTVEKPYSCSECGECFIDKSQLIKHQRAHTGEKPYSCSHCDKCFADKSSFVKHENWHTREKPYSCSECGKSFKYKSILVTHYRIHTGEKPYSCSLCGKRFTQKIHFASHQRIHTGEKSYLCS